MDFFIPVQWFLIWYLCLFGRQKLEEYFLLFEKFASITQVLFYPTPIMPIIITYSELS